VDKHLKCYSKRAVFKIVSRFGAKMVGCVISENGNTFKPGAVCFTNNKKLFQLVICNSIEFANMICLADNSVLEKDKS